MYASCGVSDPVPLQNQPIFVGQSFGGLNSGRLFYGNRFGHRFGNRYGHHDYTNADRPHPNRLYHERFQQGGVNLGFRNKQFGLQINSNNFGSTSYGTGFGSTGFSNSSAGSTNVR